MKQCLAETIILHKLQFHAPFPRDIFKRRMLSCGMFISYLSCMVYPCNEHIFNAIAIQKFRVAVYEHRVWGSSSVNPDMIIPCAKRNDSEMCPYMHWNRKIVRVTAQFITRDVEDKLQRLQWRTGQSISRPFRFCVQPMLQQKINARNVARCHPRFSYLKTPITLPLMEYDYLSWLWRSCNADFDKLTHACFITPCEQLAVRNYGK